MKYLKTVSVGIGYVGRALAALGRGTIALIGICGVVAALANYTMTQGSGTTFGSIVVSTVHYAQMLICDSVTPANCAKVQAGNSALITDVSMTVADPNLLAIAKAPVPCIAGTAPTTQTAVLTGATTAVQCDLNGNPWLPPSQVTALTPPTNTGYATSANQITGSAYGNAANFASGTSGNVTNTAQTTIITAPSAGKLYVTDVECFNSGTTASTITLNDGAATVLFNPAGQGIVKSFLTPLVVGATTALKFTPGSSSTNQWCNAQAYNAS